MIIDANILLYAVDQQANLHSSAAEWLEDTLNGNERVGLPWQTIGAFLRIVTNARIYQRPLSSADAWSYVQSWLAAATTWIPPATEMTASILSRLTLRYSVTGNMVPDAQLAALAIEHGVALISADSDFALFDELRWVNPLKLA